MPKASKQNNSNETSTTQFNVTPMTEKADGIPLLQFSISPVTNQVVIDSDFNSATNIDNNDTVNNVSADGAGAAGVADGAAGVADGANGANGAVHEGNPEQNNFNIMNLLDEYLTSHPTDQELALSAEQAAETLLSTSSSEKVNLPIVKSLGKPKNYARLQQQSENRSPLVFKITKVRTRPERDDSEDDDDCFYYKKEKRSRKRRKEKKKKKG